VAAGPSANRTDALVVVLPYVRVGDWDGARVQVNAQWRMVGTMKEELNTWDWQEAFGYAGEPKTYAFKQNIESTGEDCSTKLFTREDVSVILGMIEGENDGAPWRIYGQLFDGRYFYLEAGCDYTGWDCGAGGSASVALTKQDIISKGLTEEARRLFGLTEDIVGTIKVRQQYDTGAII
jgi:hypothetical protein